MSKRTIIRTSLAGTAGLFLAVAAPLAASAHVTIDPESAEPGDYSIITVKVPNESATASTERVELALPTDTPFTSVRYVPIAGWSAQLVTSTLPEAVTVGGSEITEAVTSVVWTAEPGSEIGEGQLQQFDLSVGPVPDTGSVALPTTQTYTDGEVVAWDEDGADPEHPAPVLYITDTPAEEAHSAAGGESHDAGTGGGDAGSSVSASSPAPATDDVLARVLGIGGLVVGAVGIVLAVAGRRRTTTTTAS